MNQKTTTRPPLESLACVNKMCDLVGQKGQGNLLIRKVYSQDKIRYLRCTSCQREFSERKGTSLWNTKIREVKAISVAEHLSEGNSLKGTARLVKVANSTVRRLCRIVGQHAQAFHDKQAHNISVDSLHADERWGFVTNKKQPMWEAEVIDPASKFVLSHVQGERNGAMIQTLLADCASRLSNRHEICLFTDGFKPYATHFPAIFGIKENKCSCEPERFRIPRSLAHVQVSKEQASGKLKQIHYIYRHGTKKRVHEALLKLAHTTPNTAIIERRNLTARSMNATQVRKSLAFGRHPLTKYALGRWTTAVYNWCRTNRMLKEPIRRPTDKKSMFSAPQPWLCSSLTMSGQPRKLCALRSPYLRVGDNLTLLPLEILFLVELRGLLGLLRHWMRDVKWLGRSIGTMFLGLFCNDRLSTNDEDI